MNDLPRDVTQPSLDRESKPSDGLPLCHHDSQQHTHTHLMALFPGLSGCAGTRKVKPIWILLKQETVSGSGICKSATRSRQITMPAPHRSVFTGWMPFLPPTNSVKALKASRQPTKKHVNNKAYKLYTYGCCSLQAGHSAPLIHLIHVTNGTL